MKVIQSSLTFFDLMDYTVHGILQARLWKWIAFPFSRGILLTQRSNPRLLHCRRIFYQLSHKGRRWIRIKLVPWASSRQWWRKTGATQTAHHSSSAQRYTDKWPMTLLGAAPQLNCPLTGGGQLHPRPQGTFTNSFSKASANSQLKMTRHVREMAAWKSNSNSRGKIPAYLPELWNTDLKTTLVMLHLDK